MRQREKYAQCHDATMDRMNSLLKRLKELVMAKYRIVVETVVVEYEDEVSLSRFSEEVGSLREAQEDFLRHDMILQEQSGAFWTEVARMESVNTRGIR